MIVVTGGAGFIGSNIIQALNAEGETRILVVDRLGENFRNLTDLRFSDFMEPEDFRVHAERGALPGWIDAIFHQGACSDTTCADGHYMMENNFSFSKAALRFAMEDRIPFIYASSAAVYGANKSSQATPANEHPLNLYALSKLAFDNYVRSLLPAAQSTIVGLRYFNVYGPREKFKGRMASMVYQLDRELRETGTGRLFEGSGGYKSGEQRRDFVFVGDLVQINLFFARRSEATRAILNVGTGASRSFNDVANAIIGVLGKGRIEYIPFPEGFKEKYQSFTEADVTDLRKAGWAEPFTSLEDGIARSSPQWIAEG